MLGWGCRRQQQALAETAAISSVVKAAAAAAAQASQSVPEDATEGLQGAARGIQQLGLAAAAPPSARPWQGAQQDKEHAGFLTSVPSKNGPRHDVDANGSSSGLQDIAALGNSSGTASGAAQPVVSNGSSAKTASESVHVGSGAKHVDQSAIEAASDSKASVPTASDIAPAWEHVNGNSRAADADTIQDGNTARVDERMRLALANMPSGRTVNGSGRPANGMQPVKQKHIPAPMPNTSPRIKSALLAAEEYRKKKAAKTAALALAAAHAAAAAGGSE